MAQGLEDGGEKNENSLKNNHLVKRTPSERRKKKKKLSIMKSGILMMMCCCRLSPLPHGDDMLSIVWTCLPVAMLSLCLACTLSLSLSLERITELCLEENQNIKQSYRPVPHAEPMWAAVENNSTYKSYRGSAVVPSCGQKSEKQAGMREGLVIAELITDFSA